MKYINNPLQKLKIFGLLALIFLIPSLCIGQGESKWEWQSIGDELSDVAVLSGKTAIAVGGNGTIAKTNDGGNNWQIVKDTFAFDINAVHFVNDSLGWAVGSDFHASKSYILNTKDGGNNWSIQLIRNGSRELLGVHFINSKLGWAVSYGGKILHTNNGGQTWKKQFSNSNHNFSSVYFANKMHGWAVGNDGTIVHTDDGGSNWQKQVTNANADLAEAFFIGPDTGWVVGDGVIVLYTTDGGTNWMDRSVTSGSNVLTDVYFKNAQEGIVVGGKWSSIDNEAHIYATSNGGQTWQTKLNEETRKLEGLDFYGTDTAWAVGDRGKILKSNDQGNTWKKQFEATTKELNSCHFPNSNYGWAVGGGIYSGQSIIHTSDGGDSWEQLYPLNDEILHSIYFVDTSYGWAVGDDGTIFHTKDGGLNWQAQASNTNNDLYSVFFVDTNTGWIKVGNNTVLKTTNGGDNWYSPASDKKSWSSFYFINEKEGWIAGDNADSIFFTKDGGQSWEGVATGKNGKYSGPLYFVDEEHGWAGVSDGTILYTKDGGQSWQKQNTGTNLYISSLQFTNKNNGWALASNTNDESIILTTSNGGQNWQIVKTVKGPYFNDFSFSNRYAGWFVGENGSILHYNDCQSSDTLDRTACAQYESPSGDEIWTNSGTYTDTLNEVPWCDTLNEMYITVNLNIKGNTTSNINVTACNNYISPSDQYQWTQSGNYQDTIPNSTGCDSIININLTINSSPTKTLNLNTCDQYTSPSGKYTWSQSGNYKDTLNNPNGCDSIITINLTIQNVDSSVNKSGGTLEANTSGATYQWLDCKNNYAPVSGATSQSFSPSASGEYAVAVTQNGCTDTSQCYKIQTNGIATNTDGKGLDIYPNPATDQITIVQQSNLEPGTLELKTLTGRTVQSGKLEGRGAHTVDVSDVSAGVYLLQVKTDEVVSTKKVVVE